MGYENAKLQQYIRMMSELNAGSSTDISSLISTQAFILKKIAASPEKKEECLAFKICTAGQQSASQLPLFNNDRKHYTPAFLNPDHMAVISQQDQEYKDALMIKTQEECLHSSLMYQPKPSSSFCFVCKEHFLDYSKHINHPVHKKFVASSACEDMIQDLIDSEQKKRKTPSGGFVESHSQPRKARKLDALTASSTLALQYLKEVSTCVSNFQQRTVKSNRK